MHVDYEYQCANCTEHEETNSSYKIYCKRYKTYYDKEDKCDYQKRILKAEEGTPCYITTLVCELLGYDDDCDTLNILRHLRNDVMQKDNKYMNILYEYDTVGPKIAKLLRKEFGGRTEEEGPDEFIVLLNNFYIQQTVSYVLDKKYDEAISRYTEMTKALEEYYGLNPNYDGIEEYDYTQGGHGKVKKIGQYPTNI